MSESYVQIPPDSTGKKLRTQSMTVGTDDVHVHHHIIQDKTNDYQAVVDSDGSLQVSIFNSPLGISGTVDTELPSAAALADSTSNPTVPGVGAYAMGLNASGSWDRVKYGKVFDLDSGAGTENVVGVSIRVTGSGGSSEAGVAAVPLYVRIASGFVAAGAFASGSIASGALASGSIASGALASGSIASGAIASGAIALGAFAAGATSPAKNEDDASASGDRLFGVAAIRRDTPVINANVTTDGDYVNFITDNYGRLWTNPQGSVAHDGIDVDNPLKIGAKAETSLKGVTLVADADRTNLYADADGVLVTKPWTTGADLIRTCQTVTDTTSTAAAGFSAVAATYNYITSVTLVNTSDVNTYLKLQDGSGGATVWAIPLPEKASMQPHVVTFNPPLKATSANTALYFATQDAANSVIVSIAGFQSKV